MSNLSLKGYGFWSKRRNIEQNCLTPQLILVDRSERGHYLMELIAEKQKQDLNNNSSSEEVIDSVAVLQLEDPQGKLITTLENTV